MINFPTLCVDGFYKDPDAMREYALSLDYNTDDGRYPGKRTKPLHTINPPLFDKICLKFFSLFYNYEVEGANWNVKTYFELNDPLSKDENSYFNKGYIHKDDSCILAGIVYLTPIINKNTGTSIFRQKEL